MEIEEFPFHPVVEDECGGCEGWDWVNEDGNCRGCAWELVFQPWCVVDDRTGKVIVEGPMTSDHAQLCVRNRSHSYFGERVTVAPRAVRMSDL